MSEQDKYSELALDIWGDGWEAVAAALRAQGLEIERLKTQLAFANEGLLVIHNDAQGAEIEKLNTLIRTRGSEWSSAITEIAQLKAQLADLAAYRDRIGPALIDATDKIVELEEQLAEALDSLERVEVKP